MIASDSPSVSCAKVQINVEFLLHKVPELSHVKQNRLTWNEFGVRIDEHLQLIQVPNRSARGQAQSATLTEPSDWSRAKALVRAALVSRDPTYEPMQKRLIQFEDSSTAALLSTLSLWVAGELGISVTFTQPMVAVMLYAAARSSSNWSILLDH